LEGTTQTPPELYVRLSCGTISDYLLALKENQCQLHQQAIAFVDQHISNDFADVICERFDEEPTKKYRRIDSPTRVKFVVPKTLIYVMLCWLKWL
jgi:23S rRNA maturation mini-RNase III